MEDPGKEGSLKLNLELDTGLSGSATTDMEQNSPVAFKAGRETSLYKRYPVGQWKPYCLQLDASLVEVIDSPPPPAHAWKSEIVTDIIRMILPDLNEAMIAGDGIAILFFGSRAFAVGLALEHAEIYADSWQGKLIGLAT